MRSPWHTAALLLGAAVLGAGLAPAANDYGWGWGEHAGPVYGGPYAERSHHAGSYRGSFARGESRCLVQGRAPPAPRKGSRHTMRVCR
jgi:hypothetical protein